MARERSTFFDDLDDASEKLREFSDALEAATGAARSGSGPGGVGGKGGDGGGLFGSGIKAAAAVGIAAAAARGADPFARAFAAGGSEAASGSLFQSALSVVGNTPLVGPLLGASRADYIVKQAMEATRSAYAPLIEAGIDVDPESIRETFRLRSDRAGRRYDFEQRLAGQVDQQSVGVARQSIPGGAGTIAGMKDPAAAAGALLGDEASAHRLLEGILDELRKMRGGSGMGRQD